MNVRYPEIGYTPDNLRTWIKYHRLSREQVAQLLRMVGYRITTRAVDSWVLPLSSRQRRNMPHNAWAALMSLSDLEIDMIRDSSSS